MSDNIFERRHFVGLVAVAGASLVAWPAQALPRGSELAFRRASRLLEPFGIDVFGDDSGPFDIIGTNVRPLPGTAYTQAVMSARDVLSVQTTVLDEVSSFEHFHEHSSGEIIPCVKTTIEKEALAIHELFDDGAIQPCVKVSSEMLEGARIGTVDFVHLHEHSSGEIIPCVKTTIVDHALATHELFDDGAIIPCVRVSAEMLEGARIGTVDFVHFHEHSSGEIVPCIKTTIVDHALATHEIFDAAHDGKEASVEVATEMLDGGKIGAIDVLVSDPNAPLSVRIGERLYVLADGALIER